MIPVSHYDNTIEKLYNFTILLKENKIFVGSVYASGHEVVDGPRLGDQVLEIDGEDYRNCNADCYCILNRQRLENSTSSVSLLVKRGNKELNFKVTKEALFLNK